MNEARQTSPWSAVIGWVALGVLVFALGGILLSTPLADARGPAGTAVHIAGILALVAGTVLLAKGLLRATAKPGAPQEAKGLESQAERLGQPTEPEAYQDGGLAVAASTRTVEEAEVVASLLRGAGIPAWVNNRHVAGWYWHAQYSMFPDGFQVLVPHGRLADSQAALARQRHEPKPEEHEDDRETAETEARLLRQAMALSAVAILVAPVGLYILFRAFRLSAAIARASRPWWVSPVLRRAHRWTLAAMLLATVFFIAWWGLFFPAIVRSCVR